MVKVNFTKKHIGSNIGARGIIVLFSLIFSVLALDTYAQIDSRNQTKPDKEQHQQGPDGKKKRLKSKKNPRFKGKKAYSNRQQIKRGKKSRAKNVDQSPTGDITGRKVKSKKTPRTTIARPQPDPYKNRRIRTEKSRAGPQAPEVRSATRKGERARVGDISGQKTVRQRSVKSAPKSAYPQPNPYIGRKIKTEKVRAKSNSKELRSIRSSSRPPETKNPRQATRPVTTTAAPKLRTKKHVYRNHEQRGGERSTDKDIAGRKIRTKDTRSAQIRNGGQVIPNISPYTGRPRQQEGERFKRSRALPVSARSISRPPESAGRYRNRGVYATHRNFRTPRVTGVVKAKAVRSTSQPGRRGDSRIYGKKYNPLPPRSVSGRSSQITRRAPAPPVSISGRRKIYHQRNTYQGKDRHFGENSTIKDIAGRNLRTRNHRSGKPNNASSGFMPYYGRSAPLGAPKQYRAKSQRRVNRAGWNNGGVPLLGKGRSPGSKAASNFTGKMPLSAIPGYGQGKEGAYAGNMKAKSLRKYGAGIESGYSGHLKARKPLGGGGSISRRWNNNGQPLQGKGRSPSGEAISGFKGKMPLSAIPGYGQGKTGSYSGNIKAKSLQKYGAGAESSYAGRMKATKPLVGGGSVSRRWNNNGQPLQGKGRSPSGEAISGFQGKMPLSAIPGYGQGKTGSYSGNIKAKSLQKYGAGVESSYAGRMRAIKPLVGGGSITRHWNNNGQPLQGKGRSPSGEAISGYKGKMPLSAIPGYGQGKEGTYAGNIKAKSLRKYGAGVESSYAGRIKSTKPLVGGGSITRHWNNNGRPLQGKGRSPRGEAISGYQGKMPLSAIPGYGQGKEGTYAGNIKAKSLQKYGAGVESRYAGRMKATKPLVGGGSITRHWNNNEKSLPGKGRNSNTEAISGYQGKMSLSALPSYGKGNEGTYQGNMKVSREKRGYHTENFIGGNAAVKQKRIDAAPGGEYGSRKKFLFVYFGEEGGHMQPVKTISDHGNVVGQRIKVNKPGQSPGTENGRTRALTFLRIGNPTQGGLHQEFAQNSRNNNLPKDLRGPDKLRQTASPGTQRGRTRSLSFVRLGNPTHGGLYAEQHNMQKNNKLPADLSGSQKYRIKGATGLNNGRARTFSFWAIGNPTKGGLVYSPMQAKGRMHPSSSYTLGKPRNSVEEKNQPIKLRIWWAKLFKKNAAQPDAVKEKHHRPRFDKDERSLWETAERPNWYKN